MAPQTPQPRPRPPTPQSPTIAAAHEILSRPILAAGAAPPPLNGCDTLPVSEQEIIDVLNAMERERQAAELRLATAGDERERLLALLDSDDAILSLGSEIDRANLLLERLERLTPQLHAKHAEIRSQVYQQRWLTDRD